MFGLLFATSFPLFACGLDGRFGQTPVMGYNTYNDIACGPTEKYLTATMKAMKDKGLIDLGYQFFQLDCGWASFDRQANGSLTYDRGPFPNGIRPLADLAIQLGLKWSMYTDAGKYSCGTDTGRLRPGSLGHEEADALQFAGWNVAYVKVDNCYIEDDKNVAGKGPRTDFPTRFGAMSTALQRVGIMGMLVCQWGVPQSTPSGLIGPSTWTPPIATSFRLSDDIAGSWRDVMRITNQGIHIGLLGLSGPGHFADMDMLEVGNRGLTPTEQQTHYSIWATFKSPLILGTSIVNLSPQTQKIVSNPDVIAINQDPLGEPVKLVQRFTGDYDLYLGNLANGDRVAFAFDQSNKNRDISFPFSLLNIESADVKDLYTGKTTPGANSVTQSVSARGSVLLRLSSIKAGTNTSIASITYYGLTSGTLSGGAKLDNCRNCSTSRRVTGLGSGASVTVSNVRASAETMDVLFDYINCEIGYSFSQSGNLNLRGASISVNGGAAQSVEFPLTGYNWETDIIKGYKVRLNGFKTGQANTIRVSANSAITSSAPDFDRIGIMG